MSDLRYDVFSTPVGWSAALVSPRGLRMTALSAPSREGALKALGAAAKDALQDREGLTEVRRAFLSALSGTPVDATVRLDMEGAPPFFRAAWEACRRIPRGETRSYGWLAEAAGRPGAARAAGQAMARNRFAPIVPCHRVVGGGGDLHGYGGGLPVKARLLELEGVAR